MHKLITAQAPACWLPISSDRTLIQKHFARKTSPHITLTCRLLPLSSSILCNTILDCFSSTVIHGFHEKTASEKICTCFNGLGGSRCYYLLPRSCPHVYEKTCRRKHMIYFYKTAATSTYYVDLTGIHDLVNLKLQKLYNVHKLLISAKFLTPTREVVYCTYDYANQHYI